MRKGFISDEEFIKDMYLSDENILPLKEVEKLYRLFKRTLRSHLCTGEPIYIFGLFRLIPKRRPVKGNWKLKGSNATRGTRVYYKLKFTTPTQLAIGEGTREDS
jgi:hypothetical protein